MGYDLEGARKAGISDQEILSTLAEKHNYDLDGAREAGISDNEILNTLATAKPPSEPVVEKESPELMGYLGAGAGAVGAAADIIYSKGRPLIRMAEKAMGMPVEAPPKPRTFLDPTAVTQQAIERRSIAPGAPGSAVETWAKTQHTGDFLGGAEYGEADKIKKAALEFEAKNPTQKVLPGSLLAVPEAEATRLAGQRAELAAAKDIQNQAEIQRLGQTRAERLGERSGLQHQLARKNIASGAGSIAIKVGAPILGGYELGSQGAQAYNRLARPDLTASDVGAGVTNVLGAGAGALSMLPSKYRIPAAIAAQGAAAVANWLDKRNPRNEQEEQPQKFATGGQVDQPEFGEARAYEPSYSEKIRDFAAKHIGREHANRLFGGPNARIEDTFNPVSMALQTPGAIADSATGFVKAGQEGDYLGGMGNYLMGAANVAPMIKPGAQVARTAVRELGPKAAGMAEDYLSKIGGIQYAIPKSSAKMSPGMDLGKLLGSAEQTVDNPLRNAYPGIYKRPDVIAQEAAAKVAPEDPMLKQLFGVTRDDLYEMSKRQGNVPGFIPGASVNPKGSAAAESVMTPRNEQRLLDVLSEVKNKAPALHTGMHGWYTMDPQYHRMVELMGEEKAKQMYHRLNTFGGIESPNLPVPVEFNRASAANWLAEQGRMPDWIKYGGMRDKELVAGMPQDIIGVPGRVGHQRASTSQQKFMDTGEHGMISPKAPPYIQASSVPELGFQTDLPVGDAHWSRFLGLPDVRTSKEVSASVSTPELQQLAPWFKDKIAGPSGLESVPAQAILWGAGSPQTGVKTAIGAGKLELQAIEIAKAAKRMGVSPETARDLILMGKARAGKAEGGLIDSYAPGGKVGAIKKLFEEAQAAYKAKFTPGFYHGSPSNKITAFDPTHPAADFEKSAEAVYLSRDPSFSNSILPPGNAAGYRPGSTVYPVNANLGKHFDYETPEGQQVIKEYLAKVHPVPTDEKDLIEWMRNRALTQTKLKSGSWPEIENPEFQKHLINTGHDSFSMQEAGRKNIGIFKPQNIRGKFAEFNPEDAASPDFMKAKGGLV